jgi:hypothetical protein
MPEDTKKIRVFVASPGDVGRERQGLKSVIDELNTTIAPYKGLSLELVKWETHVTPSMGRAQGVINSQVGQYDIFIGIMWKRFGTPTGRAESGTHEEFQLAYKQWESTKSIRILFYFCQAPFMPLTVDEIAQLQKVVEFREFLSNIGLTWEYSNSDEFPDIVRPHLARIILDTPSVTKGSTVIETATMPETIKTPSISHTPINITVHDSVSFSDSVEVSVTRKQPSVFISSSAEDLNTVRELSSFLEALGIKVIRWDKTGFSFGRTIIEAFESTLSKVDAAIVLLGDGSPSSNLMFELGMLQGKLGRTRTVVLSLENSKLPSDVLGTIYLRYSIGNVKAIMPNLQREFQHMGLIDIKKR